MAQGRKTPTQIDLAPGDAALVIRENGEMELLMPDIGDAAFPSPQVMLMAFAVGFEDEQLGEVLLRIIEERRRGAGGDIDPVAGDGS